MLAVYGFHSEIKENNKRNAIPNHFVSLEKVCYLEVNKGCNLLNPYLLTVLLSMPFNKLPLLILGATTCTTLAFIMPGLCHYSLFRNELTKSQIFLDLFLAGFGILLAIVGTYDAVNKYNYPDPNHPHVPPIPIANSHLVQTAAANSMNSIGS